MTIVWLNWLSFEMATFVAVFLARMEEIGESGTFTLCIGRRISGAADEKAIDPDEVDIFLDLLSLTARLPIHTLLMVHRVTALCLRSECHLRACCASPA
jgi:hypothetical protein